MLFAMQTNKLIVRSAIYTVKVTVPPSVPAFVRTEFLFFPSGVLLHFFPTVETEVFPSLDGRQYGTGDIHFSCHLVPPAE